MFVNRVLLVVLGLLLICSCSCAIVPRKDVTSTVDAVSSLSEIEIREKFCIDEWTFDGDESYVFNDDGSGFHHIYDIDFPLNWSIDGDATASILHVSMCDRDNVVYSNIYIEVNVEQDTLDLHGKIFTRKSKFKKPLEKEFDETTVLANVPEDFVFAGGAGGWYTRLNIKEDGTFAGQYTNSDMGDIGTYYPNGTRYECKFQGKFKDIKKISNYEYSMQIESFWQNDIQGSVKIVDGIRVIITEPCGFEKAGEFRLYLPGRKIVDLPEDFLNWVHISEGKTELTFWGLYNVGGKTGFSSYEH